MLVPVYVTYRCPLCDRRWSNSEIRTHRTLFSESGSYLYCESE